MKVALVYDRVNKWGGAERVLLALHELWPQAPLYTSVYNPETAPWAKVFRVIPSFLQAFPLAKTNHERYSLLMPFAFESFNFDEYDLVISLSSEAAKGILTKPKTLHLCYCLTPTRYLWSGCDQYFDSPAKKIFAQPFIKALKAWDLVAAQRPDEYIAISKTVQERIAKYYKRESGVVYPPVETDKFRTMNYEARAIVDKYFLVVSRLVKYKKVDLVVETFNRLGWSLKVIGVGREYEKLRRRAGKNIEFLGQLTDKELLGYYQNCQAVIFPPEEDFGIVPLEAQAAGRPVIAFRAGGARETVIEGKTGIFFDKQTVASLTECLKNFKSLKFESASCRQQAEKFSLKRFKKEFELQVLTKWQRHTKTIFTP